MALMQPSMPFWHHSLFHYRVYPSLACLGSVRIIKLLEFKISAEIVPELDASIVEEASKGSLQKSLYMVRVICINISSNGLSVSLIILNLLSDLWKIGQPFITSRSILVRT